MAKVVDMVISASNDEDGVANAKCTGMCYELQFKHENLD